MSLQPMTWKDAGGNIYRLRVGIEHPNGDTSDFDAEPMRHVLTAVLLAPKLHAAMREALGPTEEAQAQPLLRGLVQRFCDALPEDIEKATVAELVGMCELECNAEHERAVAAEETCRLSEQARSAAFEAVGKLTNQVGKLVKLLHAALVDATEEKELWQDEAREALGLRPAFNLRKAYNKSLETIKCANDTAEERLQEIWKLEEQIRQQQAREKRLLEVAEALWQLLDDIDTLGDSMHPELSPYLTAVQARVTRRFEHFESDGYSLTLTEKSP